MIILTIINNNIIMNNSNYYCYYYCTFFGNSKFGPYLLPFCNFTTHGCNHVYIDLETRYKQPL